MTGNHIYIDHNTHKRHGVTLYVKLYCKVDVPAGTEICLAYGVKYWSQLLKYPDLLPSTYVSVCHKGALYIIEE